MQEANESQRQRKTIDKAYLVGNQAIGQIAGISGERNGVEPARLPGVTREVEGMSSDLDKLNATLGELRARMENGLKPNPPTPDRGEKTSESRMPPSPLGEALGAIRYKIRLAQDIVGDLHSRLDI